MLQGAFTAIVTPFDEAGAVDFGRLREQVGFQIEQGVDGLVPVGTTGESPTLSHDEHAQVIAEVVKTAAGRVRVIAGTGSNATSEALDLTRRAADAGADATLQVNPYYNKPSQEGMYRHFVEVADHGGLPVVLYNIPGRCGVALTGDTIVRLAEHEQVVAVKEATGSLDMASDIASRTDLAILSGDDSLTLPMMTVGGRGVVSVLSNLIPSRVKALVDAALGGRMDEARKVHLELFPLCRAMLSLDTNPVPIKTAMALRGMDSGVLRLPMCAMDEAKREALRAMLPAVPATAGGA